ncbi:triple tyrosine motif-containing protein [Ectobacillus polymachus]|uniref:triple tyrosine motif-containing protein n=1 Tax=Ectobacillus polymachus TaxID=1508806 RepID=UPI003A843B8F
MFKRALNILFVLVLISITFNSNVSASNNDITPPTLKSISILESEVHPGDTLHIEMEASDSESGVNTNYLAAILKSDVSDITFNVYFHYNPLTGKYEGTYTIPATMANGKYSFSAVLLEDMAGNSKFYYPSGEFTVSGGNSDITPPTLKSISILESEVHPGDTLHIEMEASDSESGVNTNYLAAILKSDVSNITFNVYFHYNPLTGKYEGTYTIPATMANGKYSFSAVLLEDMAGNSKFYYPSGEFTVSAGNSDITPPSLKSISILESEVHPGDTLHIEMEASDSESGVNTNYLAAILKSDVSNITFNVYFHYNPLTGKYEGTYTIPATMTNGKYSFSAVLLEDMAGNSKFYYPSGEFTVSEKVTKTTMTFDKVGPQVVGSPIQITATSQGISEPEYRFFVRDSKGQLSTLQEYSANNKVTWTPTTPDNYSIIVQAKDKSKSGANLFFEARSEMNYQVQGGEVQHVNLSTDQASPQASGTPITFTASSDGSSSPEYRFFVRDSKGQLSTLQEYSANDKVTWTPTTPDNYSIIVQAKDKSKSGANLFFEARSEMNYQVQGGKVQHVNLSTDQASPQASGTPITFTASSDGSSSPEYRFFVRDSKGQLSTLQEYSANNKVTWTPTTPGNYSIIVQAKDISKSGANLFFEARSEMNYQVQGGKVQHVNVSTDQASPQASGTPITFTASSDGSSSPEYRIFVRDSKGTLSTLQEYSANNKVTWTPTTPGNYSIIVQAKDVSKSGANLFFEARIQTDYKIN